MAESLLLSIIVPVFNVEKYLERCIESLFKQGLNEDCFEVILINDGATDGSLNICKRYSGLHTNIQVISQKNQGLSGARNTGIDNAKGKYLCFVDADDYLVDDGLSGLIQYCKSNIDLIRYWCKIIHLNTREETPSDGRVLFMGKGIGFMRQFGLETFCWNYLYRSYFLKSHKIRFTNVIGEDFCFMTEVLFHNPTILSVAMRIYNYEIHNHSISTTRTTDTSRKWVKDLKFAISKAYNKIEAYETSDPQLYECCMSSLENKMIMYFSRLLTAELSLHEFKENLSCFKSLGLLPLKRITGGKKNLFYRICINLLCKHPRLYLFVSEAYSMELANKLRLKIDRNK